LEYPIVFVAGCEDGVFPHSRALDEGGLEEERRLFYVGVTRAKRELYLTHARRRAVFGAQTYGLPSRFLDEIPAELLDRVQAPALHSWAGASVGAGAANGESSFRGRPPGAWAGRTDRGGRAQGARETAEAATFRMGQDIVHASFGEGVVTGVEPGGVIVVRFAKDGSERKLMAEYAEVSRQR
jgi:DNA helicase-2/ATP-dependent DNA helicase PcrA